jgi:chemotaxis-related protein WspB
MLTFEIGDAAYALPIADVLEVSEVARAACVPTLPPSVAGVVNHHGDALPVVSRALLFELDDATLPPPAHLLVVGDGAGESARLGLPVDRVLGLASVDETLPRGSALIKARRPLFGRIVHILCTDRLLARAAQAIEQAVDRAAGRAGPGQGGSQ